MLFFDSVKLENFSIPDFNNLILVESNGSLATRFTASSSEILFLIPVQ